MQREDQVRALAVIDRVMPVVFPHWSDVSRQTVDEDLAAGETGVVIESLLYGLARFGLTVPAADLAVMRELLDVENFCPPMTNFERLRSIAENPQYRAA